jgi:hypothetical protein
MDVKNISGNELAICQRTVLQYALEQTKTSNIEIIDGASKDEQIEIINTLIAAVEEIIE